MQVPDKIFMPNELLSEEWGRHIEGQDTEYIRKEALLEWAKKEEDELDSGLCSDGFRLALTMLKQKLESL